MIYFFSLLSGMPRAWAPQSLANLTQDGWESIKRNAQHYFRGNGITYAKRKKSLLLFHCGEEIQELFERLPPLETIANDTSDS